MALVSLTNVVVHNNPTGFTQPLVFEIQFECLQALEDDLEWKVLYVSSAEDAGQDQTLEEVMVGPVPVGVNKFILQADAPDVSRIPEEDLIGVTVILLTCSYREQEFVRVGYYVNNEYSEAFDPEHPPRPIDIAKLVRVILAEKPRVTRFSIDWGLGLGLEAPPPQTEEEVQASGEAVLDMAADDEDEDDEDEDEDEEGSGSGGGAAAAAAAAAGDESLGDASEEDEDDEDEEEEDSDEAEGLVPGDAMDIGSPAPVRTAAAASSSSAAAAASGMMESPPAAVMQS